MSSGFGTGTDQGGSAPTSRREGRIQILLLLAISLGIAFGFQGSRGIYAPDEGFYVSVAQEMNRSGDYLTPRSYFQPWLDKPPVNSWAIAAGMRLLGQNEWGARAFHGLCFVVTTLLVFQLGSSMGSRREGLLASAIYTTMILPVAGANTVTPDTPLVLWTTAAFLCFWKSLEPGARRTFLWKMLMCAALGLGFLTKGPAVIIPAGAMFVFLLVRRRLREYLVAPWVVPGLLLFGLTGLTWYARISRELPGALKYLLDNMVVGRTVSARYARNPGAAGAVVYLGVMIAGTLPGSLAWWPSLWHGRKRLLDRAAWRSLGSDAGKLFLFTWIAVPLIVLCAASSKLPLYALPVMPAVALATARMSIWHRPGRIWRSDLPGLSRRALICLLCSVAFLLALKAAAAHMPSDKDMRALYASLKSDLAGGRQEIAAVDDHLEGLSLYTATFIEPVTAREVPYPFFVLYERVASEVEETRASGVPTIFVCRGSDRANRTRQLIQDAGIRFRERQLKFNRYVFACEPSGGDRGVVRLALVGGLGFGQRRKPYSLAAELQLAYAEMPFNDGVILLGDNLYGDASPTRGLVRLFAGLTERGVPFYAVLGEQDSIGDLRDAEIKSPLFNMMGRRYYSQTFRDGLVELFVLDSNTLSSGAGQSLQGDSVQLDWLRTQLAESRATWKVVAIHQPVYSTVRGDTAGSDLAHLLEPLFTSYGVTLVLQGHDRVYERLVPRAGVVYVTCGNATSVARGGLGPGDAMRSAGNDRTTGFATVEFSSDSCKIVAYDALDNAVDEAAIPRAQTLVSAPR